MSEFDEIKPSVREATTDCWKDYDKDDSNIIHQVETLHPTLAPKMYIDDEGSDCYMNEFDSRDYRFFIINTTEVSETGFPLLPSDSYEDSQKSNCADNKEDASNRVCKLESTLQQDLPSCPRPLFISQDFDALSKNILLPSLKAFFRRSCKAKKMRSPPARKVHHNAQDKRQRSSSKKWSILEKSVRNGKTYSGHHEKIGFNKKQHHCIPGQDNTKTGGQEAMKYFAPSEYILNDLNTRLQPKILEIDDSCILLKHKYFDILDVCLHTSAEERQGKISYIIGNGMTYMENNGKLIYLPETTTLNDQMVASCQVGEIDDSDPSLRAQPTEEMEEIEAVVAINLSQENLTQENLMQENLTQENLMQENLTQENPTQEMSDISLQNTQSLSGASENLMKRDVNETMPTVEVAEETDGHNHENGNATVSEYVATTDGPTYVQCLGPQGDLSSSEIVYTTVIEESVYQSKVGNTDRLTSVVTERPLPVLETNTYVNSVPWPGVSNAPVFPTEVFTSAAGMAGQVTVPPGYVRVGPPTVQHGRLFSGPIPTQPWGWMPLFPRATNVGSAVTFPPMRMIWKGGFMMTPMDSYLQALQSRVVWGGQPTVSYGQLPSRAWTSQMILDPGVGINSLPVSANDRSIVNYVREGDWHHFESAQPSLSMAGSSSSVGNWEPQGAPLAFETDTSRSQGALEPEVAYTMEARGLDTSNTDV